MFGRKHAGDGTKNHDCRHNEVNRMMMCYNLLLSFFSAIFSSIRESNRQRNLSPRLPFFFFFSFLTYYSISLFSTNLCHCYRFLVLSLATYQHHHIPTVLFFCFLFLPNRFRIQLNNLKMLNHHFQQFSNLLAHDILV